jgi:phytoene synthase
MTTALARMPELGLVRAGNALAQARTRTGSRSFYFASFALEGERRAAAYALYTFFRGADDAVDDAGTGAVRLARLQQQRDSLARIYAGAPHEPLEHALHHAVERFEIPRGPIAELLEAVAGDVGRVRLQSWEELDAYCYGVASTVGLAMAPLLGAPSGFEKQAAALGYAMQLTNILRDVREDLVSLDRVYLPAEAMARHGVDEAELRGSQPTEGFRALSQEIAERANQAYAASEVGIRAIAPRRSRLTVRLMRATYREILKEIERRSFDLFRERVVISTSRKLALAAAILVGLDPARP